MSETKAKIKAWIKKHEKIFIGGCAAVGFALGSIGPIIISNMLSKKKSEQSKNEDNEIHTDYGRDCVMKFVVDDESQEVLGEIPCTEYYAKQELELYK